MADAIKPESGKLVRVGRIAGPHGLRGEMKIDPLTDFDSRWVKGSVLVLQGVSRKIELSREHKGRPLIKLAGIDSIDAVEKLQFQFLEAHGEPEADEDEFLVEDLIGLRVLDQNGEELGEVDDVIVNPAHETLVVGEILIPFVEQFVDSVDFDAEIVRVTLIPGMWGEPDAD